MKATHTITSAIDSSSGAKNTLKGLPVFDLKKGGPFTETTVVVLCSFRTFARRMRCSVSEAREYFSAAGMGNPKFLKLGDVPIVETNYSDLTAMPSRRRIP